MSGVPDAGDWLNLAPAAAGVEAWLVPGAPVLAALFSAKGIPNLMSDTVSVAVVNKIFYSQLYHYHG
jgi:hypothetical protein